MTKGIYSVEGGAPKGRPDTSFRACVLIMLVFIILCTALMLIAWLLKTERKSPPPREKNTTNGASEKSKWEHLEKDSTPSPEVRTTEIPTSTKSLKDVMKSDYSTTKLPTSTALSGGIIESDRSTTELPTLTDFSDDITEAVDSTTKLSTSTNLSDGITESIGSTTKLSASTHLSDDILESDGSTTELYTSTDSSDGITESIGSTTKLSASTHLSDDILESDGSTTELYTSTDPSDDILESDGSTTELYTSTDLSEDITASDGSTSKLLTSTDLSDGIIASDGFTTEMPISTDLSEGTIEYVGSTTGLSTSTGLSEGLIESDDSTIELLTSTKSSRDVIESHNFTTPDKPKECDTAKCKMLASRLLGLMGHSAKPCTNFYNYACGGLQTNPALQEEDVTKIVWNKIKDEIKHLNIDSSKAFIQFKNMYLSCISYNAEKNITQWKEEVNNALEGIGSFYNDTEWTDAHSSTAYNLTNLLLQLFKYHSTPLFDVMLDVDDMDTNRFAIKLTAPLLKSPFNIERAASYNCRDKAYITTTETGDFSKIYQEYKNCTIDYLMDEVLTVHEALKTLKIVDNETIIRDLTFEYGTIMNQFILALPKESIKRDTVLTKNYIMTEVKTLNKKFSKVEWQTLLTALLKKPISEETKVQLYFDSYFTKLFELLNTLSLREVHNTLLAAFIYDLYYNLHVQQSPCNRKEYCLKVTAELMEDVASGIYLSTFKKNNIEMMKNNTKQMFMQIKDIFSHEISIAPWLDPTSRSKLISKLSNLTLTMDNGEAVFMDEAFLNEQLYGYDLVDNDFVKNAMNLLQRYRQRMYSVYSERPEDSKNMWSHFLLPYSTSGIVVYSLNTVVIPLGMLSKPFYDPTYPKFVNMARLGYVLAHEIAHHFDAVGIHYGNRGKEILLSHDDKHIYDLMTDRYYRRYDHHVSQATEDGQFIHFNDLDSHLSLNERIADDIATFLTYKVYLNLSHEDSLPFLGMTNDQVFYLHLAQTFCSKQNVYTNVISLFEDEHLPPLLRVNNIAFESSGFVEVFKCKRGSGLISNTDYGVFPSINPDHYDDFGVASSIMLPLPSTVSDRR